MKARSTMKAKHGWTCIAIVVATAALTVPTAQARHAPDDEATPSQPPTIAVDDRLGPKYVPAAGRSIPAVVNTVEVVKPSGFHWDDALIGAATTALGIASIAAAALARTSRRQGHSHSGERIRLGA
jgi:hypothetical protein